MAAATSMTAAEVRQSFLDFFRDKHHTIVPSSSLLPEAPNLLFTNAGMNQFVPIFLGNAPCPYDPARAADTQKCIRAGGKHNDLEDVGYDTYHQTFFEMLGNWSFGDYFKAEAIEWAWELVVGRWGFPPERLYATVYQPGEGDPAETDDEAYALWSAVFEKAGLDPAVHIVYGGKKDNFWMMGDTGPCGPCSELHVNLLPPAELDPKANRALVNADDPRLIEIWNLVFIQFNSDGQGNYPPLPARHVDTGMGFERVASIIQGTRGFTDFSTLGAISNYNTDLFRPLFDALEAKTGLTYAGTLPPAGGTPSETEKTDIAFRVIADHMRCLAFAIADGIVPGNTGRGYVLRRILRRAVRYVHGLGVHRPFLCELVEVLATQMGDAFPELREKRALIEATIEGEEKSFHQTLDRGMALFEEVIKGMSGARVFPGDEAFKLYDTYGFPLDLTQLLARERGLEVDVATFERLMAEQRQRAQDSQKKTAIVVDTAELDAGATEFVGFDGTEAEAHVRAVRDGVLIVDRTPFYAEMGGQIGDRGEATIAGRTLQIVDTQKSPEGTFLHRLENAAGDVAVESGAVALLSVSRSWRARIEAHHSGTHLLHWALRQVLGPQVTQKGSYVGPDRLRFDFSHHQAMTAEEMAEVERLVNEHIVANEQVRWNERPYAEVQRDPGIIQFFGDKYGETVRVVTIGDGYSRELCGGTHVRATGEVGYFKLLSEGAIAAGIRRVEAASGAGLVDFVRAELDVQHERYQTLQHKQAELPMLHPMGDLDNDSADLIWRDFDRRNAQLTELDAKVRELEKRQAKEMAAAMRSQAAEEAAQLLPEVRNIGGVPLLTKAYPNRSPQFVQALAEALKAQFQGVGVFAVSDAKKAVLVAIVGKEFQSRLKAGDIIKQIAPLVGGKGGGKPDQAQGGGGNPAGVPEALAQVESLLE
ncbi:MAG: alanine--tRNA ligase [Verrucomicrobiota bacterium]